MRKTVLYILSTNYAGSHFLSLLAGSHSKAVHVGEIHRFRSAHIRKQPCYMCGDFRKCPLFRGIEPGKVDNIHETIFGNVGSDIDLLVDNSKKTNWAARFLKNDKFEQKFVHLIRDPRALVRRWDMGFNSARKKIHQRIKSIRQSPAESLSILLSSQRMLYVHKWLAQNQAITQLLQDNQLDHRVTTYHDLGKNTSKEMDEMMRWIGLEFEPGQIEYWNFQHHGTQKSEYQWVKEKKDSYFDARWKSYLTAQEQHDIANHLLVQKYLKESGIRINEEGLTISR